jgi:transcriptional regulator with XRE-family HTH domain
MHRATASGLEAGGRIPRVDTVEKLAKVLRVSPCFLAYGIDQPCDAGDCSLSAGLPARLAQQRQEKGLSRLGLGGLSGTSHTFVRDTEAGKSVPNIAKVEALAKALIGKRWLMPKLRLGS